MTTPTCPGCGAKFSRDFVMQRCKMCGLPDEVLNAGRKAMQRWQKRHNRPVSRGGSFQRRRRRHGQPAGGSKRRAVTA